MSSTDEIVRWNGHPFYVYPEPDPANRTWEDAPAVYIFAGRNQSGWFPLYIGASESLAERLSDREQWLAAQRLGATHIHAAVVPGGRAERRLKEMEKALIATYLPRLNVQPR